MLKFTGERYIPSEVGEIRIEHFHRYALACLLTKDKLVVDLACGEGYGSAYLSSAAREVVGIDLDPEAVTHAQSMYAERPNLRFECCDATRTGLPDGVFDVAVSFETIEHVAQQAEMIAEIRRVLKPDGVLVISSPNRPVYSDARNYKNEFHVKELDLAEFESLLRPHFDQVEYYGQRLAMGTVVGPLSENLAEYRAFSDDGQEICQRTSSKPDPMYFLAVCGSGGRPLPRLGASIFLPESLDLVEHYTGFARWAKQQDRELAIRDNNIRSRQSEEASLQAKLKGLRQELAQQQGELVALNAMRDNFRLEIVRAQAQLELLKSLYSDSTLGGI